MPRRSLSYVPTVYHLWMAASHRCRSWMAFTTIIVEFSFAQTADRWFAASGDLFSAVPGSATLRRRPRVAAEQTH